MSMTISVRLEHKPLRASALQRFHDMRMNVPPYVDQSRSHLNSVIVAPQKEAAARAVCEQRYVALGRKYPLRKNAAILTCGIVTFGKDAQGAVENLSHKEQDSLFLAVVQKIAEHLNTSVESIVVHRDESALHAHFRLHAVTHDGKALGTIINRRVASELQDVAASVEPVMRIGITRGKKRIERVRDGEPPSKYVNRSVKQLHDDLPREIEVLQEMLAALQEKAAKNQRLLDEQMRKLEERRVDEEKARKRIEQYEKRLRDAEDEMRIIEREIAEKSRNLERIKSSIESYEKQEKELQKRVLDSAQKLDHYEHEVKKLEVDIERKKKIVDSITAKSPMPKIGPPETVEIKSGFFKSEIAKIYRFEKIESWIKSVVDWIKREINAEFEYARKEIERKKDDLREKERVLNNKESILNDKEKNLRAWESALVHREETVRRILEKDSPSMGYNV